MNIADLHWIAGLLEGEGSFQSNRTTPVIRVAMTDEDVVRRAAVIWRKEARCASSRTVTGKCVWYATVNGPTAASWMMTLWPLLGARRRAKIIEVLARWRTAPAASRDPLYRTKVTTCHRGHPYTEANTAWHWHNDRCRKYRACRQCRADLAAKASRIRVEL
jgi:hypothetical protein